MFPALQAVPIDKKLLRFSPVWAVRLSDGTEEVITGAYPNGYQAPKEEASADHTAAEASDTDQPDIQQSTAAVAINKRIVEQLLDAQE
ncbi:hypothetical protein D3C80_1814180 [compost metagenome]